MAVSGEPIRQTLRRLPAPTPIYPQRVTSRFGWDVPQPLGVVPILAQSVADVLGGTVAHALLGSQPIRAAFCV